MVVSVVPESATHVIGRNVIHIVATKATFKYTGNVVARRLTRDVQTVCMYVSDVWIFENVVLGVWCLVGQQVVKTQDVLVAGDHFQGRTWNGITSPLLAIGSGRQGLVVDIEGRLTVFQHPKIVGFRATHIGPVEGCWVDDLACRVADAGLLLSGCRL
ncbi:hypothetical protein AMR41_10960 [Hapalosiphon sp. MRB220]|nr:hypothetical protein AMR41_10960 [Hapalosiphon sp. MRB220]